MEKLDILKIHNDYANIYDNYTLMGSYQLYVPLYKLEITYDYLKEIKLSLIEEYICRCIERGIKNIKEISFVLATNEDIISYYVEELNKFNYIEINENEIDFTNEAKVLYKDLVKRVLQNDNSYVYFDTLKDSYHKEIDNYHNYYFFEDIINEEGAIILEPRSNLREKQDSIDKITDMLVSTKSEIKGIRNIDLIDRKRLVYHNIILLIFEKDDKYKMLTYDECGVNGIDNSITEKMQKLFENGSLHEIIIENIKVKGKSLEYILKNYECELNIEENEEAKESLFEIRNIIKDSDNTKYIMNYEIRNRFLNYLQTAEESLYIISPWMNNYIIDNTFIKNIEKLLKKGVKVRIIYGISSKDKIDEDYRNKTTDTIATKMKKIASPYGDLFKISHGQTHEKLLICDRKYYINGSFNFLSYSGENDGNFRNEGSTYSENKILIDRTIGIRFNE